MELKCTRCDRTFASWASFRQHSRDAHSVEWECVQCGIKKGSAHAAVQHLQATGHCNPFPTVPGQWVLAKQHSNQNMTWGWFMCRQCNAHWVSPDAHILNFQWCGKCMSSACSPSLLWEYRAEKTLTNP